MKFLTLILAAAMTVGVAGKPDPASARPHYTDWSGKRLCVKADKTDATQPRDGTPIKLRTTCKTRETDVGQLPPEEGYHAIENNYGTPAEFDAARNRSWHVSYDNTARTRAVHIVHLKELNGDAVSPASVGPSSNNGKPLAKSGRLRLPTLYEASQLAQDYVDSLNTSAEKRPSNPGCTVCEEFWPAPTQSDNCIWTSTDDLDQPTTHGFAVCVQQETSGEFTVSYPCPNVDTPYFAGLTVMEAISNTDPAFVWQ